MTHVTLRFKCGVGTSGDSSHHYGHHHPHSHDHHHHHHHHDNSSNWHPRHFNHEHENDDESYHSHDSHDSDPHELSNHHHHHHVDTLNSGSCVGSQTKYVDILIINDHKRYSLRGVDTEGQSASIFNVAYTAYFGGSIGGNVYPGVQQNGVFDCAIKLRLIGQLTYRSSNPQDLNYATGNSCGCNLCPQGAPGCLCADHEVSAACLLESLVDYTSKNSANQFALKQIFGSIDNFALFTEEDLSSSTVGIAFLRAMCGPNSANVEQVQGSIVYSGGVFAHELGHNFAMDHDGNTNEIMANSSSFATVHTAFSARSKQDINTFMTANGNEAVYTYGQARGTYTGNGECLEADSGVDKWESDICGNGRLDRGEECDVGFDFFDQDTCCNSDCTLQPGCQCGTTEPCCDAQGQLRSTTTVCRSAAHSTCDTAETCDGVNGQCPTDLFAIAGDSCTGTTVTGLTESGKCFKGTCRVPSDNCVFYQTQGFITADPDTCTTVCRNSNGAGVFGPVESGTPCGDGKQCRGESDDPNAVASCVDSSTLRFYHWFVVCGQSPVCRDETGNPVDNSLCEDSPPACSNDPTNQPTPFPTLDPTPYPSNYPSITPTSAPSRGPTVPGTTGYPTQNPVVPPTSVSPTSAPTQLQYFVEVTLAMEISAVTTSVQNLFRSQISARYQIPDDIFSLNFKAGSVVMTVTFNESGGGSNPQQSAQALASESPQTLSLILGTTVTLVGDARRAGDVTTPATDGDGNKSGDDGGGGTDIIVISVIAVVVVLAVALGLWYACCRKKDNAAAHRRRQRLFLGNQKNQSQNPQVQLAVAQVVVDGPTVKGRLPPGWTLQYTQDGNPYYFNSETGQSQWQRPIIV